MHNTTSGAPCAYCTLLQGSFYVGFGFWPDVAETGEVGCLAEPEEVVWRFNEEHASWTVRRCKGRHV